MFIDIICSYNFIIFRLIFLKSKHIYFSFYLPLFFLYFYLFLFFLNFTLHPLLLIILFHIPFHFLFFYSLIFVLWFNNLNFSTTQQMIFLILSQKNLQTDLAFYLKLLTRTLIMRLNFPQNSLKIPTQIAMKFKTFIQSFELC